MKHLILLTLSILCYNLQGQDCTGTTHPDHEALLALYNSTSGSNWINNDGWIEGAAGESCNPCDWQGEPWFGIECNQNDRVICIDLDGASGCSLATNQGNNLVGPIPVELSQLQFLESLYFSRNKIGGEIPSEIGSMINLVILEFEINELTGEIPLEIFELENLKVLNFSTNEIIGEIPVEISKLTNLNHLDLGDNQFIGEIPVKLSELSNLNHLDLGGNQFTGEIPLELSELQRLNHLDLGVNQLKGDIPIELTTLINLEILILWDNQLTGEIPRQLSGLKNLQTLYLDRNQFAGEIPNELSELVKLEELQITGNDLIGGIPVEFSELVNLRHLSLANNQLTGEIPKELLGLTKLEHLGLGGNNLNGEIPKEIASLINLEILNLDRNQFSGEIPKELSELNKLERLVLNHNLFTGCFPSEFITLCYLNESQVRSFPCNNIYQGCQFDFRGNEALPWEGDFIQFCNTDGSMNSQIGQPCLLNGSEGTINGNCECKIEELDCDELNHPDYEALISLYNSTDGSNWTNNAGWIEGSEGVTCDPCDWNGEPWYGVSCVNSRVHTILLNNNNLSGTLIDFKLDELEELLLLGNSLVGEIPDFSHLSKLTTLTLGENNLEGSVPNFSNLTSLFFFNATFNDLSGELPSFSNTNLGIIQLWENNLSGSIPMEWSSLPIQWLLLSNNNLSGDIPSYVFNSSSLERINLSANNLSGCFQSSSFLCGLGFANSNEDDGFNFIDNPSLPWQGDYKNYCDGLEQFGSFCDDLNSSTENDQIVSSCDCQGELISCNDYSPPPAPNIGDLDGNICDSFLLNQNLIPNYNATLSRWDLDFNCVELDTNITYYGTDSVGVFVGATWNDGNSSTSATYFLRSISCDSTILESNCLIGSACDHDGDGLTTDGGIYSCNCSCVSVNSPEAPHPDYNDLIKLYTVADGVNWTNNNGWKEGAEGESCNPCNFNNIPWYGLNCRNGRVVDIDLDGQYILNDFSYIFVNQSEGNNLTGTFPNISLESIERISLRGNNLTGALDSFNRFTNLTNLDIGENLFSGSLNSISSFPFLESWSFDYNSFSGEIPSSIAAIGPLFSVRGTNNNLSGCFPEELLQKCDPNPDMFYFIDNPLLPWQGDFSNFCETRASMESQIGQPCLLNGQQAVINNNCECVLEQICDPNTHPDYDALIKLYNSTDGPNWTINYGWKEGAEGKSCDPCNFNNNPWYGIHCSNGRVEKIDLDGDADLITFSITSVNSPGNNLTGSFPNISLENIERISLRANNLTGTLDSLNRFTNLTVLDIGQNSFSGSINSISSFQMLRTFSFDFNNFTGEIPASIIGIDFSVRGNNNNLSGCFPEELWQVCAISQLRFILNDNPLLPWQGDFTKFCLTDGSLNSQVGQPCLLNNNEGIINENCECSFLNCSDIEVEINGTTEICENQEIVLSVEDVFSRYSWSDNSNDNSIRISSSGIYSVTITDDLGCIGSDTIIISDIEIGGRCDDENPNTNNDVYNDDCSCAGELTQIPDNCRVQDSLTLINLKNNFSNKGKLSDQWDQNISIDNWFGVQLNDSGCVVCLDLDGIDDCDVLLSEDGLDIIGDVNSVSRLKNLRTLSLGNIGLENFDISSILFLSELENLSLNNTASNFSIDQQWSNLNKIEQLVLSNNIITGTLSGNEILSLNNLRELDLANNFIEGNLPREIRNLTFLRKLNVQNNDISGSLPESITELDLLRELNLSQNSFSGNLPATLSELRSIEKILFNDNNFEGCFPDALEIICSLPPNINSSESSGYNFMNNNKLPWKGDLSKKCDGDNEMGALCEVDGKRFQISDSCSCEIFDQNEDFILWVFTPDGDGINDLFVIPQIAEMPEKYDNVELVVFNRWGQVVYRKRPYKNDWDGTFNGKTLPNGSYFFLTRGVGVEYDGFVTILR